jgi:hypothetical protein
MDISPISSRSSSIRSVPRLQLPGAISLPPMSPSLSRSDAVHYSGTICVPVSKRLPGHPDDQCEEVDNNRDITSRDIRACNQARPCGPVNGGRKHRKMKRTQKHKKSKKSRKTRRMRV